MRKDINKVLLEGNLGKDPVVRTSPGQDTILATVSLCTNYTKKVGQDKYEKLPTWHILVFYGEQAVTARDKLKKGMRLSIEGRNTTRKYTDPVTQLDKYITEVVVNKLTIVERQPQQNEDIPTAATG